MLQTARSEKGKEGGTALQPVAEAMVEQIFPMEDPVLEQVYLEGRHISAESPCGAFLP